MVQFRSERLDAQRAGGIGLVLMAVMASALGGFIASRLRTRWVGIHTDEVDFRDNRRGCDAKATLQLPRLAYQVNAPLRSNLPPKLTPLGGIFLLALWARGRAGFRLRFLRCALLERVVAFRIEPAGRRSPNPHSPTAVLFLPGQALLTGVSLLPGTSALLLDLFSGTASPSAP